MNNGILFKFENKILVVFYNLDQIRRGSHVKWNESERKTQTPEDFDIIRDIETK